MGRDLPILSALDDEDATADRHKPSLRSVDEAMRRQVNVIPFLVTIPPEGRDEDLPEKLKRDFEGLPRLACTGPVAAESRDRGHRGVYGGRGRHGRLD
jgi:hypothetical protein